MSFNDPLCCGFIKAAVYIEYRSSKTYADQFSEIKSLFPLITQTENSFKCRSKKISETFASLGKTSTENLDKFLSIFSLSNYQKLPKNVSSRHGTLECKGCLSNAQFRVPLAYLPIKKSDKVARRKAEEKGLFVPVRRQITEAVNNEVDILNQQFRENYSVSFESALRLSGKSEERVKRSEIIREIKEDIEVQWAETAVVRSRD